MRANSTGSAIANPIADILLTETNTTKILTHAQQLSPDIIVIDSIQTLASPQMESTRQRVAGARMRGRVAAFCKGNGIRCLLLDILLKMVPLPAQTVGAYCRCGLVF